MKILKLLTVSGGFLLIGMGVTVFGTTNGHLSVRYGTDIARTGLLVTIMAAGRIAAVLITMPISQKQLSGKALLVAGASLLSAGMLAVPAAPGYMTAGACFFSMGLGQGLIDVSCSLLVAGLYPERFGSMMNMVQMFFGIGCLIGPLTAGTILSFSYSWKIIYVIQGLFGLVLLITASILRFPDPVFSEAVQKKRKSLSAISSGTFMLLAAIMLLYSGAGHSLNAWVNRYMLDVIRMPAFSAAGTLAAYNLGLTAGRLLCSIFIGRIGSAAVLRAGAAGAFLSITAALFSGRDVVIVFMLFAVGIFLGGLFPTSVTVAVCRYPDKAAAVTGALILAASFGSMTIPALTGWLASLMGIARGIKFIIIPVIMMTAAAFLIKAEKKPLTGTEGKIP